MAADRSKGSARSPGDGPESDNLDPRLLLTFREVARMGSISAAARKLGWTQPALGQQIRKLEREAGTALVSRHARGVTLTPAGQALLGHADAIAGRLLVAKAAMRDSVRRRATRLQVAAFPTASAGLVAPAMARVAKEGIISDLRLIQMEPPQAVEALTEGQVDAALVFEHQDSSEELTDVEQLRVKVLGADPLLLVLPIGHPLARGSGQETAVDASDWNAHDSVAVNELADEAWISGCLWCQEHLNAYGARHGFRPDIRHLAEDHVVVQEFVAAGLGVALVPQMALQTYRRSGVVARRLSENPTRLISLLTHQADPRPMLSQLATELHLAARAVGVHT